MRNRLYSVLPRPLVAPALPATACSSPISRVRSNSSSRSLYTATSSSLPLSFFESPPPPPSSRPSQSNIIITTRLAAESKAEPEAQLTHPTNSGQNAPQYSTGPPPYSLAFTSGQSDAHSHVSMLFSHPMLAVKSRYGAAPAVAADPAYPGKHPRTRYHLDVGAFGIPKRAQDTCVAGRDGSGRRPAGPMDDRSLAVQVGEDAYFVRDNAMGVADGVGGWAKRAPKGGTQEPSSSALFARRLMHFCSEEIAAATPSHRCHDMVDSFGHDPSLMPGHTDLLEQLEDSLDDLEEGLDVLMILERAYEKTLQAHVLLPSECPELPTQSTRSSTPSPPTSANPYSPLPNPPVPTPLLEGSSTALLAILEHPPAAHPQSRLRRFSLFPTLHRIERTKKADRGAILRIAHLGDCMAMLIRGDEIAWRTDEMWWSFNTPVQLGPTSPTRARDAHTFSLPVQADDILVLASDGLSDNLWDEELLDEVVRFRRSFLSDAPGVLGRSALAGMLSEALCSRARRVSERRGGRPGGAGVQGGEGPAGCADEIPFARRAREHGSQFRGGKTDDITVLVAVVSPVRS